jgi:transcriptional regulator NrdR family protein
MKCPICKADPKFLRTYETIQHRNLTERRKLCLKCGSAWKTMEHIFEKKEEVEKREEQNALREMQNENI